MLEEREKGYPSLAVFSAEREQVRVTITPVLKKNSAHLLLKEQKVVGQVLLLSSAGAVAAQRPGELAWAFMETTVAPLHRDVVVHGGDGPRTRGADRRFVDGSGRDRVV